MAISVIRLSAFMILVYGAFTWIMPSLVPPYLAKKAIQLIMCGIVAVMAVSEGISMFGP